MQPDMFCAGDARKAKVLVVGHDPRLQETDTLAAKALFGDYYFKAIPTRGNELAKYKLAEAVYGYVGYLTSYKYTARQIALTNLCNEGLPHAPRGKTVYIPEDRALKGIREMKDILSGSDIEVIFAMSAQVNYWLQKLEFYPAVGEYVAAAEPLAKGVEHNPPYYEQRRGRAFTLICGNRYLTKDQRSIFPILHVKNWPLRGGFVAAYKKSYETCINALK